MKKNPDVPITSFTFSLPFFLFVFQHKNFSFLAKPYTTLNHLFMRPMTLDNFKKPFSSLFSFSFSLFRTPVSNASAFFSSFSHSLLSPFAPTLPTRSPSPSFKPCPSYPRIPTPLSGDTKKCYQARLNQYMVFLIYRQFFV